MLFKLKLFKNYFQLFVIVFFFLLENKIPVEANKIHAIDIRQAFF